VPVAGALHPHLEYVVRGSVGAAAPAYVLADPIVRITIEGIAESLQSLFDWHDSSLPPKGNFSEHFA
jgi:hypothetical protein